MKYTYGSQQHNRVTCAERLQCEFRNCRQMPTIPEPMGPLTRFTTAVQIPPLHPATDGADLATFLKKMQGHQRSAGMARDSNGETIIGKMR